MTIVHTGLSDKTFNLIKNSINDFEFINVHEQEFYSTLDLPENADIVLIGEATGNPVKIAQIIYTKYPFLSVVLINDPLSFQKIKQSLLFTPFLGPTIYSVSNAAGKGLADIIKDHSARTHQRKSYSKIKNSISKNTVYSLNKIEKASGEILNKVLEETPIGVTFLNKNGTILFINQYASTLFKIFEREVLGTSFVDLFPEDIKEEIRHFFLKTASNNRVFISQSEGNACYLEINISELQGENNSYKIALISDVTDHFLARKAIEETANRVKIIIDSIPDMAWTALPDGQINYLNQQWYNYTGQKKEEALGLGWVKAIHSADVKRVKTQWKEAVKKGIPYEVEVRYWNSKLQAYNWHITRANPVRHKEGTIIQWVGTCTDIQKLKSTEEELTKITKMLAASNDELHAANEEIQVSNEELSAANEEIQASNDELFKTNERLVRVNADLDNFIYTASHDLKAPITNIEGLARILKIDLEQNNFLNDSIEGIVNMIHQSIERFQRTIFDLTEISKIQRLSDIESDQVIINEIINDVVLDLQPQILAAGVQLEIQVEETATIPFSRKNLKSIVYNLISNAIKYRSLDRKPFILIKLLKDTSFDILSVKDNGLGLDMKDEKKIFSMFQRLHSHVEGTGIGLYMVKRIIENVGGKITVESKIGEGSTFRVFLPK